MERDAKVEDLWNKVADRLSMELDEEEIHPAVYQAVLRFLKDNEVEALPVAGNPLELIRGKLPFTPKVGVG